MITTITLIIEILFTTAYLIAAAFTDDDIKETKYMTYAIFFALLASTTNGV